MLGIQQSEPKEMRPVHWNSDKLVHQAIFDRPRKSGAGECVQKLVLPSLPMVPLRAKPIQCGWWAQDK